MRRKCDCCDCGKKVNFCNSHRSKFSVNGRLCYNCYVAENRNRIEAKLGPIIPEVNNSTKKEKSVLCEPETKNSMYLKKEEEEVIKKKYKFNSFERGTSDCKELTQLRTALASKRNQRRSEGKFAAEEINKIKETSVKKNKDFLKGLL